ncbi:Protein of uncharacterised function (DUF3581) [Grimontia hollisae]|uniref:DUF3581 domain-containing protein n=3 Tax=Grimontia hollisae TaxID=673 RepID=D0IAB7_GRIHO|nr:hypothetical protein VHA_002694 [Grimontia hollisae CIP 101886]STO44712.1 Protein of uncharacterised function (DUF3581) [Grimontia hollisae]STO57523.1 Protein of uncharacterised function (DUF3581) [Grimontia hollisae]STQ75351.1 Protein of uncharacterised function (DUF3581) [Grimontia hollisae]
MPSKNNREYPPKEIMQLNNYFSQQDGRLIFSRKQASHFAKFVAGDFNPIHDEDSKRFCVPGDLLFSVLLAKAGISQKMQVSFTGMISDNVPLTIRENAKGHLDVVDVNDKCYLTMHREGENRIDERLSAVVAENYVKFSGMNFPHIMVPLMEESGMMINPERPLVMYESMALNFEHLNFTNPTVELTNSQMEVSGKRGSVILAFAFKENGEIIGEGKKKMVCSGLREYESTDVNTLVEKFNNRKAEFLSAQTT